MLGQILAFIKKKHSSVSEKEAEERNNGLIPKHTPWWCQVTLKDWHLLRLPDIRIWGSRCRWNIPHQVRNAFAPIKASKSDINSESKCLFQMRSWPANRSCFDPKQVSKQRWRRRDVGQLQREAFKSLMVKDVLKAASANHYGCCTFRQRCIYLSSWQPPAQPKSNSGVKYDQSSKKTCLCVRTTLTLRGPSAASTLAYGYGFYNHATTCHGGRGGCNKEHHI